MESPKTKVIARKKGVGDWKTTTSETDFGLNEFLNLTQCRKDPNAAALSEEEVDGSRAFLAGFIKVSVPGLLFPCQIIPPEPTVAAAAAAAWGV